MNAVERLLRELNSLGIKLWLDGDRLGINAPKGALTAELRNSLVQHKEHLLSMLRNVEGERSPSAFVTPDPEGRYEPFPLNDVQHAYWMGRQAYTELGGVTTHFYIEVECDGLDIERLNIALQKVIERHDMLRAVIQADGSQRVLPVIPPYKIKTKDMRGLSAAEQERGCLQIRDQMSHQVLPADQAPLFDVRAVRLSDAQLRLYFSWDLLIVDARSIYLLLDEWRTYYEDPSWSPPVLEFSYRDYVYAEEATHLQSDYLKAEAYWHRRLDDLPPSPELPLAVQPEKIGRPHFKRNRGAIPEPQWKILQERARKAGLTPSVFLMAAFSEVLRLWSRQTDFTLNLTLFKRLPFHPQVDRIVGDFTSLSLLASRAIPGESFITRATRLQQQLSEDLAHLAYSGIRVLRERARRLGSTPGIGMPVVFTSALALGAMEGGVNVFDFFGEYVYGISQTPQVWLDHQVFEEQGALVFNWDAVDGLFPQGMLEDMFNAYVNLLRRFVDDDVAWTCHEPLLRLPVWQEEERAAANATQANIPATTLHGLVADQTSRQPQAIAVITENTQLTYEELSEHAYRLARRLRNRGAQRNVLIAVSMDKGWEQIAAVLGILHSGAAYLPIDPRLPRERQWDLASRGEVTIVVTQSHLRDGNGWPDSIQVVTLDDEEQRQVDSTPLDIRQSPDDLAYMIFTSGSTGEPKGVVIDHRGASNTVQDINARFGVRESDRVLAVSALNFDLSVYDIFGVLGAGGAVVMPTAARAVDPIHWTELITRYRVTLWNSVPALLQLWVDYLQETNISAGDSLRIALLSGDWIPVKLPAEIRTHVPSIEVVSLGGATEASIWSVIYPIKAVAPEWKSIPYGKPLANQTLHVYNAQLESCPVWSVGEIHIGGIGLAKEYWRDLDRTQERFIVHPRTGERLYKTGDLGRYLPGGDIEFLGREDFRVKINGHRVELGEIAAHLRRLPGVHEGLVNIVADAETSHKQLIAYILLGTGPSSLVEEHVVSTCDVDLRWSSLLEIGSNVVEAYKQEHAQDLKAFEAIWSRLESVSPLLMARTLSQMNFFRIAEETESVDTIISAASLHPKHRGLLVHWLDTLVAEGMLKKVADGISYQCVTPLNHERLDAKIHDFLSSVDTDAIYSPFIRYYKQCADSLSPLLKGKQNPLELLFPNGESHVADALYQFNPSSAAQNRIAAGVMRGIVDHFPDTESIRLLEVGAGTGGVTATLLPVLPPERTRYRFTDLSSFFTDNAKVKFGDFSFLEFSVLDINKSAQLQGYEPQSFDVIVAANVLHDATDIEKTLRYLRSLLAPGGILLMIEGTKNTSVQMTTVGFIEGFGHDSDRHERVKLPLMPPLEWEQCCMSVGFARFAAIPGEGSVCSGLVQHVMIAEAPANAPRFSSDKVRSALEQSLPAYMIPHRYVLLDELPLSANGKIDFGALPTPLSISQSKKGSTPPGTDSEKRLFQIWMEALGHANFGIEDDFFAQGGDSLHAVRVISRIQNEFGLQNTPQQNLMQQLFETPILAAFSRRIDELVKSAK